jgi:hypothetical protein
MSKFRKKPVVIEAVQFTQAMRDGMEKWPEGVEEATSDELRAATIAAGQGIGFDSYPIIRTLEGNMTVSVGDWVIRGVNNELYPCKPDIFDKTYEPV